jgi:hypothetical protein
MVEVVLDFQRSRLRLAERVESRAEDCVHTRSVSW